MADVITRFKAETTQWDASLRRGKKGLDDLGKSASGANKYLRDFGNGLKGGITNIAGLATGAGAAIKALDLLQGAIANNISTVKNFETSVSQLSSLTGLTGAALDDLKQKAIDLGGSTTQSASQVVDAYKLIGSQKPELLKNADALNDVTKAAITLAEAATMDVKGAATALTASLNIMGEGADQAQRYINVLAAASKEGSVDIQGLTEIIYKSGQAASLNKLSFEQFIAAAETIGPKFGSAAEAGTALNQMLLKLETQTDNNIKPSVVGFAEAMENLKAKHLSAADATKLVTETGYKALVPILENTDALKDLTDRITGTNTAMDQARTNTANLDGALKSLESAWEKFNLTIGSSEELTHATQKLTDLVNACSDAVKWFGAMGNKWDDAMAGMGSSIGKFLRRNDLRELASLWEKFDQFAGSLGFGGPGTPKQTETKKPAAPVAQVPTTSTATTVSTQTSTKTEKKTKTKKAQDPIVGTSLGTELSQLQAELRDVEGSMSLYGKASDDWKSMNEYAEGIRKRIKELNGETDKWVEGISGAKQEVIDLYKAQYQQGVKDSTIGSADYNQNMALLADTTAFDNLTKMAAQYGVEAGQEWQETMLEKIASGEGVEDADWQGLVDKINEKLKGLGLNTIKLDFTTGNTKEEKSIKALLDSTNQLSSGLSQLSSGLKGLGIDLGTGFDQFLGGLQSILSVINGVQTIINAFQIPSENANTAALIANTAALQLNSATSFLPFAQGGIAHAANGFIGGNNPSGDLLPIMVNSGELILNKAQQGNLASQLGGGIGGGLNLTTSISMRELRIALNSESQQRGKGKYVTTHG